MLFKRRKSVQDTDRKEIYLAQINRNTIFWAIWSKYKQHNLRTCTRAALHAMTILSRVKSEWPLNTYWTELLKERKWQQALHKTLNNTCCFLLFFTLFFIMFLHWHFFLPIIFDLVTPQIIGLRNWKNIL